MMRPFKFLGVLVMAAAVPGHASDKKILDSLFGKWTATQGDSGRRRR